MNVSYVGENFEISIYVMDADGSNQTRVGDSVGRFICPTWSPDSDHWGYTSPRDGNLEIYVVDADGTNETRLTHNSGDDEDPQWSPDGSKIVFSSARKAISGTSFEVSPENPATRFPRPFVSHYFQIYLMDADGSNEILLSDNTTDGFDDHNPRWSPDGQKIAFLSDREKALGFQIYVMDSDGSNESPVTKHPQSIDSFEWSPDGQQLLFSSEGESVELYVLTVDGLSTRQLLSGYGRLLVRGFSGLQTGAKSFSPTRMEPRTST